MYTRSAVVIAFAVASAACSKKAEATRDGHATSSSIAASTKPFTGPRPKWTKGPSDAYHCTRYLPDAKDPGAPIEAIFLQDERFDFDLHADSTDGSKVEYSARDLPPGATLDAKSGHFSWTMKAKANDRFEIVFVATTSNDGRAEWPFTVVAADDDRDLAWRLGAGVAKPDCAEHARRRDDTWSVRDFDGDGHVDVLLSLGGMHRIADLKVWRDDRYVSAFTREDVDVEGKTASDGAVVLVIKGGCCGHADLGFARFDPTLDEFGEVGACSVIEGGADGCRNELALDAAGNVAGCDQICEKSGRTKLRWKGRTLDLVK